MGWWSNLLGRREESVETRTTETTISLDNPAALRQLFGLLEAQGSLPVVSIAAALQVPAVFAAVAFLSRTLAALPLHSFAAGANGERLDDDEARLLNEAPNEEWSSFDWRRYHWQQVFTGGRGMSWIERRGPRVARIWPMDPEKTTIGRRNGRKYYRFGGREYPAGDVIDTPFMLCPDQLTAISPIVRCNKAISLAIAMTDFAGGFFLGGGMPPLALEGPLPSGAEAFRRAATDIKKAVELAKASGTPFFPMPPGHALKPVGTDPEKGQMTEARLFQIQEIARVYQLPPVFLQDLSKGTFSNTEQQDLTLTKHLISQWAKAFEDELNLKLFGWRNRARRVKHNLNALQRGTFKERIEALALAIQTGQSTLNEVREVEDRSPYPASIGTTPFMQGAIMPIGAVIAPPNADNDDEEDSANDGHEPA